MVGYLARYERAEQGRGRVGTCGGGSARAVGAYAVEKIPACGAHKAVHFWPMVGSLLLRGGKRLPIDASQSASASGLESAVAAAADSAGDPGLAGTATGAAAAAAARSAGRGFSTGMAAGVAGAAAVGSTSDMGMPPSPHLPTPRK